MTEGQKDLVSSIPKLLELNLEETRKTWGDEVEDALKLQEDEMRSTAAGAKNPKNDRSLQAGSADARRYDLDRIRMEGSRSEDRPPAKKMKDEPRLYRNQRDDSYMRDRVDGGRGGRGRGKDSYRSGGSHGSSRSSANDSRYVPTSRDGVVSEYQPSHGVKRGTLTFERSNLHPERQASFESKRGGQFRFSDSGTRPGREDRNRESRGKDRGENYTKKDDRVNASKSTGAQGTSETVSGAFTSSSDHAPARTNAWSRPLHGSEQSTEPAQLDGIPDVIQWNADGRTPLDSAPFQQADRNDSLRKDSDLLNSQDKPEIESQFAESRDNDRESGKRAGSHVESSRHDYRGDRGRRQSRRGRRQNWSDQTELCENEPRYGRRSQPRMSKEGRSQRTANDENKEVDETESREERSQGERRRTMRYSSGGRGLYQSGRGEYPSRSRGRGMLIICMLFDLL